MMPAAAISTSEAGPTDTQDLQDRLTDLVDGDPVSEVSPSLPDGRRRARALVVQALYETDLNGRPAQAALLRLAEEQGLSKRLLGFASSLVERVEPDRLHLDRQISESADEFPTGQIATIDRSVLRVALAEFRAFPDLPVAVIINEAVEVAGLFGSESSGKFVNGVLGALLR
jgi:N utilization substance protein B